MSLDSIDEHIEDHEVLGVKSQSQLTDTMVTKSTAQTITGQKKFNQDLILQSGQKLIFDG